MKWTSSWSSWTPHVLSSRLSTLKYTSAASNTKNFRAVYEFFRYILKPFPKRQLVALIDKSSATFFLLVCHYLFDAVLPSIFNFHLLQLNFDSLTMAFSNAPSGLQSPQMVCDYHRYWHDCNLSARLAIEMKLTFVASSCFLYYCFCFF